MTIGDVIGSLNVIPLQRYLLLAHFIKDTIIHVSSTKPNYSGENKSRTWLWRKERRSAFIFRDLKPHLNCVAVKFLDGTDKRSYRDELKRLCLATQD